MDALGGVLLYLGLMGAAIGVVCAIYPLRFIAIRTRKSGLILLLAGFGSFAGGVYLPAAEMRVDPVRTRLDAFIPEFQFSEFHSTYVEAPVDRVYAAIHEVRPGEIRLFQTLMRLRFLRGTRDDQPILKTFTSGWFLPLADDPEEIVFGRAAHPGRALKADQFVTDRQSPLLKIAMNFRIHEVDSGRCLLTTETRVYALGADMRRGFATYWRLIRPGSGLIRRGWLRAIKLRAETPVVNARAIPPR